MKAFPSKRFWRLRAAALMAAVLIGAILVIGMIKWMPATANLPRGDVPLFQVRAWETPGELLLHREGEERGGLLLKHSERDPVYRYDPATRSLSLAARASWERSNEQVAECALQVSPLPPGLRIEPKSDRLLTGEREIATAGRTTLALHPSPSGKWAAVVSAESGRSGSLLPFLGRGGASGQHYHQILSLSEGVLVGKPVRLPLGGENEVLRQCWSPDERYVVYADVLFFHLSVVSVDVSGR